MCLCGRRIISERHENSFIRIWLRFKSRYGGTHTQTGGERVANVRRKSTCCVLHWVFFYLCFPFFCCYWLVSSMSVCWGFFTSNIHRSTLSLPPTPIATHSFVILADSICSSRLFVCQCTRVVAFPCSKDVQLERDFNEEKQHLHKQTKKTDKIIAKL